jgi:hypothetical protein
MGSSGSKEAAAPVPCTSVGPEETDSMRTTRLWNEKKAANMSSAQERRDNLLNKDNTLSGLMGGKKRSRSNKRSKSRSNKRSKSRSKRHH